MSECSNNCESCSEECSSRKMSKEDFLEPLNQYSNVKKLIGIVSGKGGVGKSLITSCLSVLFNRKGYETAILDADITGPSIPKAFGIHEKAKANELGILPAITKNGIKIMSVNLLLEEEDTPVIWRGPVIAGTVKQFWSEVVWENVDYMFVDMPPGTGDVPLTVFQSLPLDGIIIVTSPQELVSMIVSKAVNMAKAMDIPILGVVENYSYMECEECGKKLSVFGESHIEEIAEKFGIDVLAKVPIDPKIAKTVDSEIIEEVEADWLESAVEYIQQKFEVGQTGVNIKIAVTTDENNNIFQHFGKSERFTVYEFEGNTLLNKTVLESNGTGHGALGELLKENSVDILICGGIGEGAVNLLQDAGIKIVSGISGDIDVAVSEYLAGSVSEENMVTCSHHHETSEDESCQGGCSGGCGGCH